MLTGGVEFEARKQRLRVKLSNMYIPRNTSHLAVRLRSAWTLQLYFDNTMSANRFDRLLIKNFRYSKILGSLTSKIALINSSYIRHSRLWINFTLKKTAKTLFQRVPRGGTLCGGKRGKESFRKRRYCNEI